jgi:hypothetical protein
MSSKIPNCCTKLIALENVITDFKDDLNDQDVVIKKKKLNRRRTLKKVSKISDTTESIKNKIETIGEQREKEKENSIMEMTIKIKEKNQLVLMIKNHLEQLLLLKK